jgi:hypothetical protein
MGVLFKNNIESQEYFLPVRVPRRARDARRMDCEAPLSVSKGNRRALRARIIEPYSD